MAYFEVDTVCQNIFLINLAGLNLVENGEKNC